MKTIILTTLILAVAFLYPDTIIPAGDVSGTWTSVGSPYLIQGEITVPDDETLQVEPGVIVEFQGHFKFHVQGRLLAIGTISDTIVFTINDTTNFHDMNLQEGAWQGIRFNNTPATNDSSMIIYCRIEYGKANSFDPPCSGNGGGLYAENYDKLLIRNTEFSNNKAMLGGAIALDGSNGIIIQNTLISNNESSLDGGGIYCVQSSPVLDNVILIGNHASGGGGIACWYNSSPTIMNTSFINNSGTVHGGGIYCKFDSSPSMTDVVFTGNSSSYGAAMNFNDGSNPRVMRALVFENSSTNSSGAFSCGYDSYPVFINSTIFNNSANNVAGVSYIYDSHPVFINTIIWNNTPEAFYFSDWHEYTNSITFTHSDVQGGTAEIINSEFATVNWLEGNIILEPEFLDPDNHDFSLDPDSPCIDTGTAFFEWNAEVLLDLDQEEYYGIAPDMGVFEYEGTATEELSIDVDTIMSLSNYPNPFNPSTTIVFSLSKRSHVDLEIYNLKGQKIRILVDEELTADDHRIEWNGSDQSGSTVPSSIYLYTLKTESFHSTKKMILLK